MTTNETNGLKIEPAYTPSAGLIALAQSTALMVALDRATIDDVVVLDYVRRDSNAATFSDVSDAEIESAIDALFTE